MSKRRRIRLWLKHHPNVPLWAAALVKEFGVLVLGVWVVGMVLLVAAARSPEFAATALSQALPDDWPLVLFVLIGGMGLFTLGIAGEQEYSGSDVAQRESDVAQRESDVAQRERQVRIAQREIDVTLREKRIRKQNRQMTAAAVSAAAACVMAGRRR